MQTDKSGNQGAGRLGKRLGFWLGLALFVGLLAAPVPSSMREAVGTAFGAEVARQTGELLEQRGMADPRLGDEGVAGEEGAAVREQVVEARARVMLAAAAVTVLVACWWITVAVPIPVTSLLPLVLFPLVGVMPIGQAAAPYANSNVFLFMGGFIIALGIERWDLHRRIALHIVRVVGGTRRGMVLGFMVASAALSMWISNTATVMMMLPIGMAIISAVSEMVGEGDSKEQGHFAAALMLGIAYGASVGGVATPIGTPPNVAFAGQFELLYPDGPEIGFGRWLLIFLPLVVVFLPIIWLVLVRVTCPVSKARLPMGREVIERDLRRLGSMGFGQWAMLAVFATTGLLWMTRSIPVGGDNYGWSAMVEAWLTPAGGLPTWFRAEYINDATVALFMAVLLFVIPARRRGNGRRAFLMDWETAQKLPWGILLLFGGGFSLAEGFKASGLSVWCGTAFAGVGLSNPLVLVLATCLLMTFLTEITSNTATTQVMLPVLARISHAMGVNPLMLMLPATISASCAFMLPVATPPNAIVFGSGMIPMGRMVKTGLIINLIGAVLVTGVFYLVAKPVLGIDIGGLPVWAGE